MFNFIGNQGNANENPSKILLKRTKITNKAKYVLEIWSNYNPYLLTVIFQPGTSLEICLAVNTETK